MDASKLLSIVTIAQILVMPCFCQFSNFGTSNIGFGASNNGLATGSTMMGLGFGFGDMTPLQYAVVDNAVKTIIGPHASPDVMLIQYAVQQGGPPTSLFQLLGYIPFFVNIANTAGLQQTGQASASSLSPQNIQEIIVQRAVQWMNSRAGLTTMLI